MRSDTASRGSHAHRQAGREKAICTPHAGKMEEAPREGDAVEARRQRVDDGVDLTVYCAVWLSKAGSEKDSVRLTGRTSSFWPSTRRLVWSSTLLAVVWSEQSSWRWRWAVEAGFVVVVVGVVVAGECQFAGGRQARNIKSRSFFFLSFAVKPQKGTLRQQRRKTLTNY